MQQTTQLRIIAALLIVVIAMAGGLFFLMPKADKVSLPSEPDEPEKIPPHEPIREAEISLDPALSFTQTIGGSGTETPIAAFSADDKIYIFGNTTSTDFDFRKAGAFLAILNTYGKTLSFFCFDGELIDVTLYNGGFVLALKRDAPTLLAIDYTGNELRSTALQDQANETPIDLLYCDTGYLLVTELKHSVTGFTRLKLTILNPKLEFVGALLTNETFSLEYVDTIDVGGQFMLMANAVSDIRTMLCYGIWGKKLSHFPLDFSYNVIDFWYTDDFWYLAKTDLGTTVLIKKDGIQLTLGANNATGSQGDDSSGKVTGKGENGTVVGDEKCLYVASGTSFFCIKDEKVSFSAEYGPTTLSLDTNVYAASTKDGKLTVRIFSEGNKLYEKTATLALTSPIILPTDSGLYVIGITSEKFGSSDITLAKFSS